MYVYGSEFDDFYLCYIKIVIFASPYCIIKWSFGYPPQLSTWYKYDPQLGSKTAYCNVTREFHDIPRLGLESYEYVSKILFLDPFNLQVLRARAYTWMMFRGHFFPVCTYVYVCPQIFCKVELWDTSYDHLWGQSGRMEVDWKWNARDLQACALWFFK